MMQSDVRIQIPGLIRRGFAEDLTKSGFNFYIRDANEIMGFDARQILPGDLSKLASLVKQHQPEISKELTLTGNFVTTYDRAFPPEDELYLLKRFLSFNQKAGEIATAHTLMRYDTRFPVPPRFARDALFLNLYCICLKKYDAENATPGRFSVFTKLGAALESINFDFVAYSAARNSGE